MPLTRTLAASCQGPEPKGMGPWSRSQHGEGNRTPPDAHTRRAVNTAYRDWSCRCEAGALSSLILVSGKSERQAARSVVADYHHVQLGELVARVGEAVDRYRAGELDPFEVDHVLFHYSRAAKELWKFCNSLPVEIAAAMIRDQPPLDWWERGAPRER